MKANIWAGIFSTDPFGDYMVPSFYCATGNCTWLSYSSLGVCSKCADISTKLNISCTAHAADLDNATGCDMSLANGFALGGPEGRRNHLLATSTDYPPLVYGNYTNPLAIIQTIAAYNTQFVNQSTSIKATECVISPCIINYDASILSITPNLTRSGFSGIPFYDIVDSIIDNYKLNTSEPPWNGPTLQLTGDVVQGRPSAYQMSQPVFTALKYYLQAIFNGYVVTDGNSSSYSGDNITRPIQANSADAMQALYNPIESCYDRFWSPIYYPAACSIETTSWAITTTIRNRWWNVTDFSTNFAIGQTWSPITIVGVSWLWIIPVIGMWLLCVILSLVALWRSRRAGVQGMALNPLTFIFLNLEDNANQESTAEWWNSEDARKEIAEQTQVRLRFQDRKVSLVQDG
jgi:hypothetical protein